ncbi:hypothetical protein HRR80_002799 [Exophiala dermatitidis]|uniref:Uncharacterized protein n=1 Tax=Exophiala dermatitidis TaxID=5970 RepID=A0AAN6EWX0_EXODE|nr:hypothetical protein HRR76_005327 [Exophiala dermatitidis]KAJ4555087.1 hypothetical protein HRR77_001031 [Exophiala dermatitidis]KAJ4566265.1 hypothetical protein HRR79_005278 [Exophiala dermatitidis]KAJ4571263.1 hypothetical protein HRR82_007264 [Exophiala dermatitidis]KAJ4600628.1 hypothetical protein HRR85_009183 [Exophiala dermatitidis]
MFTRYPSSLYIPYPGRPFSSSLHALQLESGSEWPLCSYLAKNPACQPSYPISLALCQGQTSAQPHSYCRFHVDWPHVHAVIRSANQFPQGQYRSLHSNVPPHSLACMKPPPSWQRKDNCCSVSCPHESALPAPISIPCPTKYDPAARNAQQRRHEGCTVASTRWESDFSDENHLPTAPPDVRLSHGWTTPVQLV